MLESSTEILLPGSEQRFPCFHVVLEYLLPVLEGPFQGPAVLSGVASEPEAEASVPLVPRLAESSWLAVRRGWLAPGMAMPHSVLPLHQNFAFQLLKQELWVPEVTSSLPALIRKWELYSTEQISME